MTFKGQTIYLTDGPHLAPPSHDKPLTEICAQTNSILDIVVIRVI